LIRLTEVIDPDEAISEIKVDPADNRVLEAAAADNAAAIVSGDQHLFALGAWRGLTIQSPARASTIL
jgi:uncharacterized protein